MSQASYDRFRRELRALLDERDAEAASDEHPDAGGELELLAAVVDELVARDYGATELAALVHDMATDSAEAQAHAEAEARPLTELERLAAWTPPARAH